MRHLLFALVLSLPLLAEESGNVVTQTQVMVPMRDGVKLATDIYLPAKSGVVTEGKYPTILTRSPYGKGGAKKQGQYFAAHGYVYVAQDVRGRFDSEGVWHMMTGVTAWTLPHGSASSPGATAKLA